MNKEKLIDTITEKIDRIDRFERPVYGQGQYDMAYEIMNEVEKIIESEPEENTHDIIYNFITQYSGGISLAIDTQDNELLSNYIKDYLNEPIKKAGE